MSFNWDGSLLATTCKDRIIRIIDPRSGAVVQQGQVLALKLLFFAVFVQLV